MQNLLFILLFSLFAVGNLCFADASRLDDIKVANTRIAGTSTRISTVSFWVDAPLENVWKVLIDYNHHAEFLPKLNEAFLVNPEVALALPKDAELKLEEKRLKDNIQEKITSDTVYLYNNYDFPFPFPDHHSLLKVVLDSVNHKLNWTQIVGDMKVNDGSWEIQQIDSMVFASYIAKGDPGIPVPPFLIKMVTKMVLPDIVKAVRKEAAK